MSNDQDSNRRHSDGVVIALSQKFSDFIERYDRDCGANNEWKRQTETTLREQSAALAEISPAYNRGKWIIGLIIIASMGILIKAFWNNISWN